MAGRRGRLRVPKDGRGRFPARHYAGLDPALVGLGAFRHPSVGEWWRWLRREYRPRYPVALVTPCSSVKPYTRSPASRKIRGLLRRLGLWGEGGPRGVEWLYLSDLLLLVPYERAEEYPACCYEVPPDVVLGDGGVRRMVVGELAGVVEALVERGLERVVLFLPRRHLALWGDARGLASRWPGEVVVKYTIFGLGGLGEALARVVGGARV